MHIEFIDLLRCPRPHAETWLVASFSRMDGRIVVDGRLGCPVCDANYAIRNGVATFEPADTGPEAISTDGNGGGDVSSDDVIRLAAMLRLSRPGMLVLLAGTRAPMSHKLAALTSCRVLTLNAVPAAITDSEAVASITAGSTIPVASLSLDGVALDSTASQAEFSTDVARVVKPGGRLVAPSSFSLPANFRELARDDSHAVGESIGKLILVRR